MVDYVKSFVLQNAKAIAAFIVSSIVAVLVKANVGVPSDVQIALQGLIIALVVWLTSNKKEV